MTPKIVLRERTLLFPKNLNLQRIISENPPNFKLDTDILKYFISLQWKIPATNKELVEESEWNGGYIPYNAQQLQSVCHLYKRYMDYLLDNNILQVKNNGQYITGQKSKLYRLNPIYHGEVEFQKVSSRSLLKALRPTKKETEKNLAPIIYPYLFKWFNENLRINREKATSYVGNKYGHSLSNSEFNKMIQALEKIRAIDEDPTWFKIDAGGKRLHTYLTNLNKDLKPYLTYNSQQLISVDIVNSQALLSIKVLIEYYTINPITTTNTIMLVKPGLPSMPNDVINYIKLVAGGTFYEYFGEELYKSFGAEYFNGKGRREESKTAFFTVLFSKNNHPLKEKRIFKKIFPNVMKCFEEYKCVAHNVLACKLQQIEANIVLGKACKELSQKWPQIPLFTIHDSIATTIGYEEIVVRVMSNCIEQEIGFKPILKLERWAEDISRAA